ncbi:uncharacterized protein EV422DRAFT_64276 [Fimicolochytrium jonesii]|uniref:uncharacterized protein n=1 Tax=Fimicolochytrium jonesii TaxID=1396493 RepID=UPI0022FF0958|nr:uncharacterized protein EV422DRAFT_64276 [Fimicolochytrium jonesii]KAI8820812.1 hypothetical protein EV422DRAFT_64276 [Fimicolochytrium jonesii]
MSTAELVSPKKSTGSSQGKPRSPSFKNKNCFSARLAAAKALSLQQMTKDAARVQIRKFFKQDVPLLFCDAVGLENGESAYDTNAVAELLLQYGIRKQCSSGSATLESARLKRRVAKVDLPEELYGWVHYRRPLEKEESEERESSGKSKKRRKSSSSMKFKKKLSLDPGRKRRKTYPVEEVVSPSPPPVPPKPPGKYAREAEERWTKLAEVQELYAKKAYLAAGFYSSAFKRGVIAGVDVENESPSRNSGRHRKVSKQAKPPAAKGSTSHRSAFPLPMYHGLKMMDEGDDFELPYDIHKFIEASGGVEECLNKHRASLPTPPPAKLPSPFVRIPRNIFVERKPYKPKEWEIPICRCDVPADGGPACTDNCLNWCTMIECHPKYCPAGDNCMNQQFRNQDTSALPSYLDLFWTNGRGYGLKVKTKIPRNQMVIEYRGEIISDETCIERMQTIYKGYENHYFLNYGKGEVIDACRKGTEARFVNHSCEPNCRIEKWEVDGECRVGIFSNREIEEGQELTYDYRFESYGPMQKCLCGASKCRGFIGVNKKEAKDAAKKAAEEANQTGTPDKGKSGKKKPKAKRLPLPRMESVSSAEGSVMCEDITDPASTILTPRTSQKKKLPVKKPNAERDFWLRKHRREHLITAYRNVMIKHYAQYAHLRIFSLRAFRCGCGGEDAVGTHCGGG